MVFKVKGLVAALESHQSVGLEGWWDTLVDAITGVKNIDDYRGKKTPWSDEYKKLMRGTFANSRWVSKQKLVDGLVAGGGISKRFGCISNSTDYWANVQLAIENSKWIDDYLKVLKKYSDDIRAIHEKLGKDYRESPDLALVRAAIKEIKALEHPMAYIVKHAKPCLHGKIMPDGKSYKIVPQNTKFESKVPALTQSQFEEAVKIIVAIHNETHPLCKQRDAFWDAAQFCDDDDLISELMDENEELGMQYSDLTYWQAVIDEVTPPGDEYEVIQAGLVLWAARSCGSTAASLESFNGTTVDLETIARTGHEAVRSLAQSFGDHSHLSWEESPDWVRNSAINGAALHVLNPGLSAEATHEAWLKAKQEEGWSCGPTKDADRKEHPCMVPYSELSTEHRLKDHLFKSVVDAFVACLKERQPDVEIVGLECACGSLEQQYDGLLNGRSTAAASVEGFSDIMKTLAKWLGVDSKEKSPPKEIRDPNKETTITKEWISEHLFKTGNVENETLAVTLHWGNRVLAGSDRSRIEKSEQGMISLISFLNDDFIPVMESLTPLLKDAVASGKISTSAVRRQIISGLPRMEIELPKGKTLVSDGKIFAIETTTKFGKPQCIKADEILPLQTTLRNVGLSVVTETRTLRHFGANGETFDENVPGLAEISEGDDQVAENFQMALDLSWITDVVQEAATLIFAASQKMVYDWAIASVE